MKDGSFTSRGVYDFAVLSGLGYDWNTAASWPLYDVYDFVPDNASLSQVVAPTQHKWLCDTFAPNFPGTFTTQRWGSSVSPPPASVNTAKIPTFISKCGVTSLNPADATTMDPGVYDTVNYFTPQASLFQANCPVKLVTDPYAICPWQVRPRFVYLSQPYGGVVVDSTNLGGKLCNPIIASIGDASAVSGGIGSGVCILACKPSNAVLETGIGACQGLFGANQFIGSFGAYYFYPSSLSLMAMSGESKSGLLLNPDRDGRWPVRSYVGDWDARYSRAETVSQQSYYVSKTGGVYFAMPSDALIGGMPYTNAMGTLLPIDYTFTVNGTETAWSTYNSGAIDFGKNNATIHVSFYDASLNFISSYYPTTTTADTLYYSDVPNLFDYYIRSHTASLPGPSIPANAKFYTYAIRTWLFTNTGQFGNPTGGANIPSSETWQAATIATARGGYVPGYMTPLP